MLGKSKYQSYVGVSNVFVDNRLGVTSKYIHHFVNKNISEIENGIHYFLNVNGLLIVLILFTIIENIFEKSV
jgi:hypothetical protein